MVDNPLPDDLMGLLQPQTKPQAPSGPAAPPAAPGGGMGGPLESFDLPIPGQSLTAEQGQMAYERPPQFTNVDDAMDFLFNKVTSPKIQRDLLRMMDAGVPITILMEPILLTGAQEGKWSMDMVLALVEPLSIILYGLGKRAGITPTVVYKSDKEDEGINTSKIREMFKKKDKAPEATESEEPELKGLLAR